MEIRSVGLSHIAMSVPEGTLNQEFRDEIVAFYGKHFGWTELERLRRADRMTVAIGGGDYVNVREKSRAVDYSGYEHFGLRLPSAEAAEDVWTAIDEDDHAVDLEPLQRGPGGYRHFRFRFLLPLSVEVQHLPPE